MAAPSRDAFLRTARHLGVHDLTTCETASRLAFSIRRLPNQRESGPDAAPRANPSEYPTIPKRPPTKPQKAGSMPESDGMEESSTEESSHDAAVDATADRTVPPRSTLLDMEGLSGKERRWGKS